AVPAPSQTLTLSLARPSIRRAHLTRGACLFFFCSMQNALWLRRQETDRPDPDRVFFSVIYDGVVVGAVHRGHATPLGCAWSWSITCRCRQRGAHSGWTRTKAEALADFRAAWDVADPDIEYQRAKHAEIRVRSHY